MTGRVRAPALGALCLVVATGCVRYQAHPLAPASAAQALDARSLADTGLARFAAMADSGVTWPPAAWNLRDLTLAALYFSPDLGAARANWATAMAAAISAGARPNPVLSGDIAALTRGARPSPSLLNIIFDIPFVTAGKRRMQVAEAERRSAAERWNVATESWTIRARVRAAALDGWHAGEAVALATQAEAAEADLVKILERRLEVGEISALDLARERVVLEGVRAVLRDAEMRRATSRVDLADAIGVPVRAMDGVPLALGAFADSLPRVTEMSEARATALISRTDIRAALANYAATELALQLEVARQYPDIRLAPALHWEPELTGLTIAPSVTLPVLNDNRGPIAVAEAQRAAAVARFTQLQARVLADVDRALERYAAAGHALAAADLIATRQAEVTAGVGQAFGAGELDRLSLLGAQVASIAARQQGLAARSQALAALGAIENALQRPLNGADRPLLVPLLVPDGSPKLEPRKP